MICIVCTYISQAIIQILMYDVEMYFREKLKMKHKFLLWIAIGVLFLTAGTSAVFSQETVDQAPAPTEETSTSTALMIDPEIDAAEDEEPDCE